MRIDIGKNKKRMLSLSACVFFVLLALDSIYPVYSVDESSKFSRVVLDEQGRLLRAFADNKGVWRQPVKLENVSENYIEALLGYEDRWFWYHPGVNPVSIFRAAIQNFSCGCIVSGGSTITMQVSRILHPHERSIVGKLKQTLRALQLELHYSKEEILTLYLNNAPFGGTIEGVQAASRAYLEKNASELTDAEAALLAVLPQAPSKLRPDRHPDRARQARDKILKRLQSTGLWTKNRALRAAQEAIVAYHPNKPSYAPILARQLIKKYPNDQVIHTYINLDIQRSLEDYVKDQSEQLPEKSSMAILVVDNQTGQVKAHVASADFNNKIRYGHVNMIDAIRSPGSTLKPFIYGLAIDEGLIHSHSLLFDAPRINSDYQPENFNKRFNGPVSTTFALQKSLNMPAVQVLNEYGPERFDANLKNAGVGLITPGKANLSIALGGAGISLSKLVTLFSSLANGGQLKPLLKTTLDKTRSERYLLTPQAAWISYKMLSSAPRPDRINSNMFNNNENPIAWKTGTSYGYRDAWAIGVTKNFSVGVWIGRPDGTPQPGHYGASTASPLLFKVLTSLPGRRKVVEMPKGVSVENICWPLGKKQLTTKASLCHKVQEAWLADGKAPPTMAEADISIWRANPYQIWLASDTKKLVDQHCNVSEKIGREIALWPRILEPWINYKYRFHGQLPEVDHRCDSPPPIVIRPLSISSIANGNVYRKGSREPLSLNLLSVGGQDDRDWYVNGKFIGASIDGATLMHVFDDTGRYEIVVIDVHGNIDKASIQILNI